MMMETEIPLLEQPSQHRVQQLLQMGLDLIRSMGDESFFQRVVDDAKTLLDCSNQVVLHLLRQDGEREILFPVAISSNPLAIQHTPNDFLKFQVGVGVAGVVMQTQKPVNISDVNTSPHYIPSRGKSQIVSLLVVPVLSDGEFLGTLSASSELQAAFSTQDELLLTLFAEQVALALQRRRSIERLQQQKQTLQKQFDRLNLLHWVLQHVGLQNDFDFALKTLMNRLADLFQNTFCQLYILDQDGVHLHLQYSAGVPDEYVQPNNHSLLVGEGLVGTAAVTRELVWTNDVESHPMYIRSPWLPHTAAEIAAPIVCLANRLYGVLDLQRMPGLCFDENDCDLVKGLTGQIALAFNNLTYKTQLQENLTRERLLRDQFVQQEKLNTLGRIVAAVAHELNNPLQTMQNALYLISLDSGMSNQSRQDMEIVLNEIQRMNSLIARLRSLYTNRPPDKPEPVLLNRLVDETCQFLKTYFRQNQVEVICELDKTLPMLLLQADQIKQVILNLCINAVEAMPNGGKLYLTTKNHPQERRVCLYVRDTGTGIPAAIQDKIFEPFFTTKSNGTGLGLPICCDILRQHGGTMSVESEEGKGSTFIVELPISFLWMNILNE